MRVSFQEIGGFVPIWRGCELDTDTLDDQEASRLRSLVELSGIRDLAGQHLSPAHDVRRISIGVETDAGWLEATFDDVTVPDPVRPLVALLRARSRDLLSE